MYVTCELVRDGNCSWGGGRCGWGGRYCMMCCRVFQFLPAMPLRGARGEPQLK